MRAIYYLIFLVQFTDLAGCCSVEKVNDTVENVIVSCSNNLLCTATCHRGYIFPTGLEEEPLSCQDGIWTPSLSQCKRLPEVLVTYAADWSFSGVPPSVCNNITTRLDDSKDNLEEAFASRCHNISGIFATVKFNYSFFVFKVFTNFEAVYQNYTNMNELNICINYTIHTFPNLQIINKLLDGVKCDDYNSSNTISKHLYISYTLKFCLNGTEVHNVKTSGPGKNEQYCDLRKISTSDTTSKMATEATISRTLETTIFSAKSWVTEEKDDSKTTIYIAGLAGGVLLISAIIILVVCVQKREVKSPETLPAVNNKVYDNSFKGELIENELYQSADNAIDSTGNEVKSKVNISVSPAAPNCKDLTQTEQELKQDQYSYPSKCKETNISVDEFKDKEIDKLYSDATQRRHQKTPNFDPDSNCQYAVVRE